MPDNMPFEVGLTGGIGSGKSVAARIFNLLNVPVYESDTEAKKLYFQADVKLNVINLLGESVYLSATAIDRDLISKLIYKDPKKRTALNDILHPAVATHYSDWVKQQNHSYVLKVAALLFEANIYKSLDFNLLVISPQELRISRIKERDNFRPESQILQIIESQMKDSEKIPLADGLIFNDEKQSLIEQVTEWDKKFCSGILKRRLLV